MGKRKVVTEEYVQQRLAAGYGNVNGIGYKPWLDVRSFRSKGNRHRISCLKTGETHHLMSNIERAMFLYLESQQDYQRFYAGVAMDRDITSAIAQELGIAHPIFPGSKKVRYVMTFDGIAFHGTGPGDAVAVAYDAKPSKELNDERTKEKLRIHRAYAMYKGMRHVVFTEKTIPEVLVRNLEWVRRGARKPKELEPVSGIFDQLPLEMFDEFDELSAQAARSEIRAYARKFDERRSLPHGAGMRVMQSLFWNGVLEAPMKDKRLPWLPLSSVRTVRSAHEVYSRN